VVSTQRRKPKAEVGILWCTMYKYGDGDGDDGGRKGRSSYLAVGREVSVVWDTHSSITLLIDHVV
jgi:hypothetical protein